MITLDQAVKLWNDTQSARDDLARRQRYYEGDHDILKREEAWSDGSPKTNLVTNWPGYVVSIYTGALTTAPFRVSLENEDGDADAIDAYRRLAEDNGLQAVDTEMLRQCLVYGHGIELHEMRKTPRGLRHVITAQDPRAWHVVFDEDGVPAVAMRNVRIGAGGWYDGELLEKDRDILTVWDAHDIADYTRPADTTEWVETGVRPHYFGRVPVLAWAVNEDRASLLTDAFLGQCDEYNAIDATSGDNIRDQVDAMLKIKGDPDWILEHASEILSSRMLPVTEQGDVDYVVKPSNSEPVVTRLKRTREHICMMAGVPDISEITGTTGATSGIALRLRFMPTLHKASEMMPYLQDCVRQRVDLMNAIADKLRKPKLEGYTVTIQFVLPHNRTEEWTSIGSLKGIVSHRTQLELLSDIADPEAELKAVLDDMALAPEARDEMIERTAAAIKPYAEDMVQAVSAAILDATLQSGAIQNG